MSDTTERQELADAWDEGYAWGAVDTGQGSDCTANPYRTPKGGKP